MADVLSIALYRGHTHGEFAFLQTTQIAKNIGDWCRKYLADKEYIPKGWHWDPVRNARVFNSFPRFKITKMFCGYDVQLQRLSVPICVVDQLAAEIRSWGVEIREFTLPDYPVRKIPEHIKMRPEFTDRPKQVETIKQCSNPTPGMRAVCMQTGSGKSYIGVKTSINLGNAVLIIVPGLVDQWIADILEYTTAKKGEDVYKLEGFASFELLANNPKFKPSIFVASTRTMQMFCNCDEGYELLPWDYAKFFKEYGIGTKIIDECHKQFHANVMTDLKLNVPVNLYLSATFDQSSKYRRELFDRIYPDSIKVGDSSYDRYVSVHFYNYYGEVDERRCRRAKGYMHALYENELMKSNGKLSAHLNNVIVPLVNQFFINKFEQGHKCLIFCATVEFVEAVTKKLRQLYPHLKIIAYTGDSDRSDLLKADMAVSTTGKASTGLDWKGLRCCINTVSLRSPLLTNQMLGRLRKISNAHLQYVDVCDKNVSSQCRHAEDRKNVLRRLALHFYEYDPLFQVIDSVSNENKQQIPS